MVKMRKQIIVAGACAMFILLSLGFVVAEEAANEGAGNRAKNFLFDNSFVQNIMQNAPNWLGFNGTGSTLFYYFLVGFLAGLMIWVVYTIARFVRHWVTGGKSLYLKQGEEIKEDWSRWPEIVAGRPWKLVLFGVFYALLMMLPMVNRVLQIITLDVFDLGVFLHALVVACEVGFLPWMLESYMRARLNAKYERAYRKARPAAS